LDRFKFLSLQIPPALSLIGACEREVGEAKLAGDLSMLLTYFGIYGQRIIWIVIVHLLKSLGDHAAG